MFSLGNLKIKKNFGGFGIESYRIPSHVTPLLPAQPSPGSYISPGSAYGVYAMVVPLEGEWLLYIDEKEEGRLEFSRPGGTLWGRIFLSGTWQDLNRLIYDQYQGTIGFRWPTNWWSSQRFRWTVPRGPMTSEERWEGRVIGAELKGTFNEAIESTIQVPDVATGGTFPSTSWGNVTHTWRATKSMVPAFVSPELVSAQIPGSTKVVSVPYSTYTPSVAEALPSPESSAESLKSPEGGEALSSILEAGFPSWGWILIAGIGLTLLFGTKKGIKGKERRAGHGIS